MLLSGLTWESRCKIVPIRYYCSRDEKAWLCPKGHCFKLFHILPGDLRDPLKDLSGPYAFALRHKRPLTVMFTVDQFLSVTGPYQERNGGWKVVRGRDRKSKWASWGGQQWDSSFECTGEPKKKGVQWSFRTCPSLVHSLSVSSHSQNRSRDHSGKSFTLILINCKPIQFFNWPLSLTSTNSVNTAWHSHLHFSSLHYLPKVSLSPRLWISQLLSLSPGLNRLPYFPLTGQ